MCDTKVERPLKAPENKKKPSVLLLQPAPPPLRRWKLSHDHALRHKSPVFCAASNRCNSGWDYFSTFMSCTRALRVRDMKVDPHVDPQQNGKNPCVCLRKSGLAASGRPASRPRPIDSSGSLTFRAVATAKNQVALTSPLLCRDSSSRPVESPRPDFQPWRPDGIRGSRGDETLSCGMEISDFFRSMIS